MELEKEIKQEKFRNDTHKLGVNILYTYGWVYNYMVEILKKYSITLPQFNVLRILRGSMPRPVSIKSIRDRMLDKMSDASRIVEKLRAKGMVERNVSQSDRRECEVIITQKGLDLLGRMDEEEENFDKIFSNLSQTEVVELNSLLDKMRG